MLQPENYPHHLKKYLRKDNNPNTYALKKDNITVKDLFLLANNTKEQKCKCGCGEVPKFEGIRVGFRTYASKSCRKLQLPISEFLFKEMWNDPNITNKVISSLLSIDEGSLRKIAKQLNLPQKARNYNKLLPVHKLELPKEELFKLCKTYTLPSLRKYVKEHYNVPLKLLLKEYKLSPLTRKEAHKTGALVPHNKTSFGDPEKIQKMITDESVSLSEITSEFNCTNEKVYSFAEETGIQFKYLTPTNHILNDNKTKDKFIKKWHQNDCTKFEMKSQFKVSETTMEKLAKQLNLPKKAQKSSTSQAEREIIMFINRVKEIEIISNDRNVLEGKEIDILLPKFGIEYHGLMWHSIGQSEHSMFNVDDNKINRNKHKVKTDLCEEKGLQLFQIFENEWENKKDIWKSIISDKLGINQKIGARKCIVQHVDKKLAREFEQKNHLQGPANASINIGLFFNKELVSLMTFSKGRQNISSGAEYELIRFCTKLNTTIQGGASRLFASFKREYQPQNITTFANRRWSQGNLYYKLGFTLSHVSNPNYFYFKPKDKHLYSRNKFQKHKLKHFVNYTKEQSEWSIMKEEYRKIYDSGNLVFKYNA